MNKEGKDIDKTNAELSSWDPHERVMLFSLLLSQLDFSPLGGRIDAYFEALAHLEEELGAVAIPSSLANFPEAYRPNRLNFFWKTILTPSKILEMFRVSFSASTPDPACQRLMRGITDLSVSELIEIYVFSFEVVYSNFVVPILSKLLTEKSLLRKARQIQLDTVEEYLRNYPKTQCFAKFFSFMDANLRNAFVHLNYYVKEGIIYYFGHPKCTEPTTIPDQEFLGQVAGIMAFRLVFLLISGWRLAGESTQP
ncbi:MAG: hypothetical protein ACE5OZ_25095 [Candidatus Heimdallarchaeota archaeon]